MTATLMRFVTTPLAVRPDAVFTKIVTMLIFLVTTRESRLIVDEEISPLSSFYRIAFASVLVHTIFRPQSRIGS